MARTRSSRFLSTSSSHTSGNNWRWGFGYAACAATLAGGVYYYAGKQKHIADSEVVLSVGDPVAMLDVQNFVHPYDNSWWCWKVYFRTKRFLYLVAVFLPCLTVASIGELTGNQKARAFGLELLVGAFESAGCGLQKFGQWLSMRPDMIPADVVAALCSLRQDTPVHSIEHTRKMLKESFGLEITEMFEFFDVKPIASGTIAQVHRARLREEYALKANIRQSNGELVQDIAVKVRHPNVLAETWCDVDLVFRFIHLTDILTIPFNKAEFMQTLQSQIDLKQEAQNLLQFRENFKREAITSNLAFPIVSVDLLSGSILLESWVKGKSVSDIMTKVSARSFDMVEEGLAAIGQNTTQAIRAADELVDTLAGEVLQTRKELARKLFDASIKMFLRDNLVHGDLHAGNVMFDEKAGCLTIIDGGLVTGLEEEWVRKDFGSLLHALCTGDVEKMVGKLMDFDVQSESQTGTTTTTAQVESRALFFQDIQRVVNKWVDPNGTTAPDGGPISLGDLLGSIMYVVQRHQVCLRSDVAACLMTMGITEGLILSLDPNFDMVQQALPYFLRYHNSW